MKRLAVAALAILLLLPVALLACQKSPEANVPPLNTGTKSVTFEITYDEFLAAPHATKTIDLTYPASLVVMLGSNASTGYQWGAGPTISDTSVLTQYEHNVVAATSTAVGAAGKDVWTFKPASKGTTTVSFGYSRPWEGGEKDEWTLVLTVVVK